jgi:O-antigen ligase
MRKYLSIVTNNFYFCIFYILTSFSFVTVLKLIPNINILAKIGLLWGAILSIRNLYSIFKRKPFTIEVLLLLFLIITLVLNLVFYPSSDNLKTWFVNLLLLTAVFFINNKKNKIKLEKELFIISNFYIILSFLSSVLSLASIILNKKYFSIEGAEGIFENENALGICAGIAILIALYLFISTTSKKIKMFYLLNIILQTIVMTISGGRSSYFIFISLIGLFIFIKVKKALYRFLLLLMPVLGTLYCFTLSHDTLYNYTQGRSEIWTSALLVIKDNLIVGVGNLELVNKVVFARPIYIPQGIYFNKLHNIYIQLFTANGLFVFLTFICFLTTVIIYLIKRLNYLNSIEEYKLFIILSLIISILLINFFESNLLFIVSFISIIFWTYLGYVISIIEAEKRDEN